MQARDGPARLPAGADVVPGLGLKQRQQQRRGSRGLELLSPAAKRGRGGEERDDGRVVGDGAGGEVVEER